MEPRHPSRSLLIAVLVAAAASLTWAAGPKPPVYTSRGAALRGYDAVAYFTQGMPVRGQAQYATTWNGTAWRFASAEHRDLFLAAPEKYAPQFGGYCAWAVSRGYTADGDPEAWTIVDDRLYINYSKSVRAMWARNIPGNIAKGRANWPAVLNK